MVEVFTSLSCLLLCGNPTLVESISLGKENKRRQDAGTPEYRLQQ